MAKNIVTDPTKQVTDPVLITYLQKQGIDPSGVEFYQDYAPRSLGKEHSPYAKFYRDLNSNKKFMVVSGLPMVDANGNKNEAGWNDNGSIVHLRYTEKNNLFHASVDGSKVTLQIKKDQPDGRKQGDKVTFQPQLLLDGVPIVTGNPTLLPIDPVNANYLNNTLEWDYGICKRRLRLIEGSLLGSWVFAANPNGEVRIKYNQTGDFKLQLGQFAVDADTEVIPKTIFDSATYPFTVSDSLTVYPDAHAETTSVDGVVLHDQFDLTWAQLIGAVGTEGRSSDTSFALNRINGQGSNLWYALYRAIYLFDTSGLGASAVISAATLSIYGEDKFDTPTWIPNINIYSSNPLSNIDLGAGDYDCLGGTAFSDTAITYASWSTSGYNSFALNATGIAAVAKTGISKFGARNAQYDVAGSSPATANSYAGVTGYFSEQGTGYKPKLVITYTVPPVPQNVGVGTAAIAGILDRKTARTLGTNALTIAGSINRKTEMVLTGALTIAGILGRLIKIVIGGALTSAGVLGRKITIATGGAITSAATLNRLIKTAFSGVMTITGTLNRLAKIAFGGALTSNGILNRLTKLAIGGVLTSASLLSQIVAHLSVGGVVAITGTLGRTIKLLIGQGAASIAGTLVSLLTIFLTIGQGAITITGTLGRKILVTIGGALTSASTLGRTIKVAIGGALTSSASVNRLTKITMSGAMTIAGYINRLIKLALGGALTISGSVNRVTKIILSGILTMTGTLGRLIKVIIGGVTTISGILNRKIKLTIGKGAIAIIGVPSRIIKISLAGTIAIAGILHKFFVIFTGWNRKKVESGTEINTGWNRDSVD